MNPRLLQSFREMVEALSKDDGREQVRVWYIPGHDCILEMRIRPASTPGSIVLGEKKL